MDTYTKMGSNWFTDWVEFLVIVLTRVTSYTYIVRSLIKYRWLYEIIRFCLPQDEPSYFFEGVPLYHAWMWSEFGWPSVIVEDDFGRKHLRFIRRGKHQQLVVKNLCTWKICQGWGVWEFTLIGSGRIVPEDDMCWEYAFDCYDEQLDQEGPWNSWRENRWDEYTTGGDSRIYGYTTPYHEGESRSVQLWIRETSNGQILDEHGCGYPAKTVDVYPYLFVDFSRPIPPSNPGCIPNDATHIVWKRPKLCPPIPDWIKKQERRHAPIKI